MSDIRIAVDVLERLDDWIHSLGEPLLPARVLREPGGVRLEFRDPSPQSAILGKLIRSASAAKAAMHLADVGFVTESAALMRMVSDYCIEITAIAEALRRDDPLPKAVTEFVAQYFQPKARTPEEYAASELVRYVSREELMKSEMRLAEGTPVDGETLRNLRRFLNMGGDAYVHGAYETAMELYDQTRGRFHLGGHPGSAARRAHAESVALKLHELVVAIELTAVVFSNQEVFNEARDARRTMDQSEPWLHTPTGTA